MPSLQVARAEPLARGVHLFELRDPAGAPLAPFTAGAHVTVTAPNGALRKYSLCNDPRESDRYVIAVKRDPEGRGGSLSLVDDTRVGDLLQVSAPHNTFELSEKAAQYLLIAGGIGITPIMAMARRLADLGKRFRMVYLTRSPEETAFAAELQAGPFHGRVTLHHDGGDPARAFDLWPLLEKPNGHVYCCGPHGLLEAVRDMSGHWSRLAVHFESFVDAAAGARREDRPFTVVLARSGDRIEVPVGVSILEALRAHGHDAPSSCESGTCGTCRTRLLAGVADHRDLVLTEEEHGANIMICVSRAATPEIAIDR
ncbi:MAG TPA: PDR/VanB family oxidoreductase [Usitatibacter sp.]|nr:PDR/VanB family oxidoreductase [Usitatibacter sp.]